MTAIESRLHRTWVQMLLDAGHRELASIAIDANLVIGYSGFYPNSIIVEIPNHTIGYIGDTRRARDIIVQSVSSVTRGHIYDQTGYPVNDLPVEFRVKLLEVEENWQDVVRNLIVRTAEVLQGSMAEQQLMAEQKYPLMYNTLKFPSHAHVRIAQEFEKRHILFFPLPLAVRHATGNIYQDHREVDFLICAGGLWGILAIALHADRVVEEAEYDAWFRKSGIRCIRRFDAEECFSKPLETVDTFLKALLEEHDV